MNPALLRLSIFLTTFLLMAGWESLSPRRPLEGTRISRWPDNFAIVGISNLLVFMMPFVPVSAALFAREQGWGLLRALKLPEPTAFLFTVLFLDLVIYFQHLLFHRVGFLRRFHLVHHVDSDVDVSTAFRFHPVEILISLAIKIAAVLALGVSPGGIVFFEALLSSSAMFNHGNVMIPRSIDAGLRGFLVTPDMHRIHHSTLRTEAQSNYGFFLSWWDRLFHTYTAQPQLGHDDMEIGVTGYSSPLYLRIDHMLMLPFRKKMFSVS